MSIKFYGYKSCSSCRKAKKFLVEHKVDFEELAIDSSPPSKHELNHMLQAQSGQLKKLFNTSGMRYRELGLKDKLASMSHDEAIDLLSQDGMLIKRPFVLSTEADSPTDRVALLGFHEQTYQDLFVS